MRRAHQRLKVFKAQGAEHRVDPVLIDRIDEHRRVDLRWACKIHRRDHGRRPKGGGEERKQGEGRQINLSRLDRIEISDHSHLRRKVAVFVDHPFGNPRAPAREQNGGAVLWLDRHLGEVMLGGLADQLVEAVLRQKPEGPTLIVVRTDPLPHPSTTRAKCAGGIPMKTSGCASARQDLSALSPIPGSINTGNAELKQREGEAKELEPGLDHDGDVYALAHPHMMQRPHGALALRVGFTKGDRRVPHGRLSLEAAGQPQRNGVGLLRRHLRKRHCDRLSAHLGGAQGRRCARGCLRPRSRAHSARSPRSADLSVRPVSLPAAKKGLSKYKNL